MALIKYMGSADIREINKGTDANGQLRDQLPVDLVWDKSNNWIIDTSDDKYSDVAQEFWDLLLEGDQSGKQFKDVSDLKRIPTNEHQQIFLGMAKGEDPDKVEQVREAGTDDPPDGDELTKHQAGADGDPDANPAKSEASPSPTPSGSTAGGSTRTKGTSKS